MSSIQYLLFDLDNTLYYDTTGLLAQVRERIREWLVAALDIAPERAYALGGEYYQTYGSTLTGIMQHYPHLDPESYLAYIHDVPVKVYLTPNPALAEMLERLPWSKVVFTNSICEWSERVLGQLGIREHFERIIDIRAAQYRGKPQPDAYSHTLDVLAVPGSACVLIDDYGENLQKGSQFGMHTILVSSSARANTWETGVDYVVRDVLDVENILYTLSDA